MSSICLIEGCGREMHAKDYCSKHYASEVQHAKKAKDEPKDPQAKGGRRTQNPNSLANLRKWQPGQSGNASGRSSEYVEVIQTARSMCPAALQRLYEIVEAIDPRNPTQAQVRAIESILDRGLGRPATPVFHGANGQTGVGMPAALEVLDDCFSTPLTMAACHGPDYESTLRAEIRRIDAEREKARAAQEAKFAAARVARANGEEIDAPMHMLLETKDEDH